MIVGIDFTLQHLLRQFGGDIGNLLPQGGGCLLTLQLGLGLGGADDTIRLFLGVGDDALAVTAGGLVGGGENGGRLIVGGGQSLCPALFKNALSSIV